MKNDEISKSFNEMADLLEIRGDNPFRIRAYRKAALNIEALSRDVALMSKEELMSVPGIGADLAAKIVEYAETGYIRAFEEIKKDLPGELVRLLAVPGVGPKTVSLIYGKYGVQDLNGLERLAQGHKLSKLPGIREKTEEKILRGIGLVRRESSRHPIGRVIPVADSIVGYLSEHAPLRKISIAGSLRRWKETIRDIDIIIASADPVSVMSVFTGMPGIRDVIARGRTKSSVVTEEGLQVDLRVVDEGSFGSALAYFTGSKAHNIRIRDMASRAGLKVNEYGIFRESDGKKLGGASEEDIYRILGLQYVPPELREDTGEIEAASENRLPELIEMKEIRGDIHVHSNWSDGNLSIDELVSAARKRGYKYLAVTDHSKGLGVARGLSEERIIEQKRMIDAINRKTRGFSLLTGIEVNIKADGSLDLDEDLLGKLDIVIASIHSGFSQPAWKITGRLTSAMKRPCVNVIGHPSGRLIGEREGYDVDMDAVLKAASDTGTAVEINAYPLRLDLQEAHVRTAKSLGVPIVIATDAHNELQFGNMRFGVAVARRGWLGRGDVLNALSFGAFRKSLKRRRPYTQ